MNEEPDEVTTEQPEFAFQVPTPVFNKPQRTIDGLGKVRHELKPDRKNLAAGMIIAFLLLAGGILGSAKIAREVWVSGGRLPVYAEYGMSWFAVGLGCLLSLGLIVGGGGLFWWALTNWSLEVLVCEAGFEWRTRSTTARYLWDDMELVTETLVEERLPIVKGPLKLAVPTQTSREFCIRFKGGKEVDLTANSLKGHGTLGFVAQQEAQSRGIPVTSASERRG